MLKTFSLPNSTHRVYFHSGATEGVNTWAQGLAQGNTLFVYSPLDHASVRSQRQRLEEHGHHGLELPVSAQGELLLDQARSEILAAQARHEITRTLLNWTWVHNETGVVWPLSQALQLKAQTGALVHVDAVQAPGKIKEWSELVPELDAYSFSGHKFGALKSVGFSFLRREHVPRPLILGGGQQEGLRSGTENVMGAWTLKLALEDVLSNQNPQELSQIIHELREVLDRGLAGKGHRICAQNPLLNLNTVLFVHHRLPADMTLPLWDLAGLEVSAGAACSSGTARPSHVLEGLGEGSYARHGLRLSLPWSFKASDWADLKPRLLQVFAKLPSA